MEKRALVYLHIGTHKTGSTAIQACLAAQRKDFRQAGIAPWLEGQSANAFRLAHCFTRPQLPTPMRLKQPCADVLAWNNPTSEAFRRHVETHEADIHLVSSESFCFLRTAQEHRALTAYLGEMFHAVVPVVVLRNRAEWETSWDKQIWKMGLREQIAAIPAPRRVTANWYFDTLAIRTFWGSIGDVTEIDYDSAMRDDGSVLPAFLRSVGQPDLPLSQPYFENVHHEPTAKTMRTAHDGK